jgi:hypothetical protein
MEEYDRTDKTSTPCVENGHAVHSRHVRTVATVFFHSLKSFLLASLTDQRVCFHDGMPPGSSSRSHADGCLRAGEAADDGSASVYVGLEDGVGGNAPALPARSEILD